jgi:hypothetical protein
MSKKKAQGGKKSKVQLSGPLGPWRLSIAVLVAVLTSGMTLYHAASTGVGMDMALGRSFAIAFVTWIVLGNINKMLAIAEARGPVADEGPEAEKKPLAH